MKSSPETSTPGRSRRFFTPKLLLGCLFVIACLVTLIAIFYTVENWRGNRAWQRYAREAEVQGDRFDRAAIIPPTVADAENFAMTPFLAPLFEFLPGTQKWRDTNRVNQIMEFPRIYTKANKPDFEDTEVRTNTWVLRFADVEGWYQAMSTTNTVASDALLIPPAGDSPTADVATAPVAVAISRQDAAAGVLKLLAEAEPVIEELRQAAMRPHARFNIRYEEANPAAVLLPHLAVLRRVTSVLQLRAAALLHLGRTDDAVRELELIFKISDSISQEPVLISHLVRIAQLSLALQCIGEGLGGHQWTDSQLIRFQELLQRSDLLAGGHHTMKGERNFFGDIFEYLRTVPNGAAAFNSIIDSGSSGTFFDWPGVVLWAMPDGWLQLERLNYTRVFQEQMLPIIDVPGRRVNPETARAAEQHIEGIVRVAPPKLILGHKMFIGLLMPALSKVTQRTAMAQTGVDLCRIACGLERYRLAKGEYPETLASLESGFLPGGLPHDVITGKPLIYRRTSASNYLLYSVGWDGEDQGGQIALTKNRRSVQSDKGDWVWQ